MFLVRLFSRAQPDNTLWDSVTNNFDLFNRAVIILHGKLFISDMFEWHGMFQPHRINYSDWIEDVYFQEGDDEY